MKPNRNVPTYPVFFIKNPKLAAPICISGHMTYETIPVKTAHIIVKTTVSFEILKNSATETESLSEYNFILQYLLCIPEVISPAIIPPNIPICSDCIPSIKLCPAISIA